MNDRVKELAAQLVKYLTEAAAEWGGSLKDSPEAHCYTLALGAILASVVGWLF